MTRAAFLVLLLAATPALGQGLPADGMTLDEAVEVALERSPDLGVAASTVDRADAERLGAWGDFLPTIELGYGYLTSSTGRLDPTGQTISTTSYTAELTGSYEIFSGFRKFAEASRTGRGVEAARAGLRDRSFRVVLDTKTAFFAALAERDRVRVEADRVARLQARLEMTEIRRDRGRASRSDVLRVEIDLAGARLALVRAEDAARAARFALGRAVGIEGPVEPLDSDPVDLAPLPLSREDALTSALEGSPALVRARAETRAAEASVTRARSRYMPSLTLAGGWSWQSTDFPPADASWRILVTGSLPIFDGLGRESTLLAERADARAARAAERAAALALRADVDSAYNQVEIARRAVELASTAVELAREELAMSRERFRLGRESWLERQDAEIALRQAELDLVRARFDHRVGTARLEYLLGRELDSPFPSNGTAGR